MRYSKAPSAATLVSVNFISVRYSSSVAPNHQNMFEYFQALTTEPFINVPKYLLIYKSGPLCVKCVTGSAIFSLNSIPGKRKLVIGGSLRISVSVFAVYQYWSVPRTPVTLLINRKMRINIIETAYAGTAYLVFMSTGNP